MYTPRWTHTLSWLTVCLQMPAAPTTCGSASRWPCCRPSWLVRALSSRRKLSSDWLTPVTPGQVSRAGRRINAFSDAVFSGEGSSDGSWRFWSFSRCSQSNVKIIQHCYVWFLLSASVKRRCSCNMWSLPWTLKFGNCTFTFSRLRSDSDFHRS